MLAPAAEVLEHAFQWWRKFFNEMTVAVFAAVPSGVASARPRSAVAFVAAGRTGGIRGLRGPVIGSGVRVAGFRAGWRPGWWRGWGWPVVAGLGLGLGY
jgi:hypothetical protein